MGKESGEIDPGVVRQLVRVSDGRIGAVVANDRADGVVRDHCDLFFGQIEENGDPKIEQLYMADDWEVIPISVRGK